MKLKTKNSKIFIYIALIACMLVFGIFGISAILVMTDTAENNFTVGKVSIELNEPSWKEKNAKNILPLDEVAKDPQITNDGDNDAYVFMSVNVPYGDVILNDEEGNIIDTQYTALFSYELNDNWVLIDTIEEDDDSITYVYAYASDDESLIALASTDTTNSLFDTVKFANVKEGQLEESTLNMVINAYAIQTDNILDTDTSDAATVWDVVKNANPNVADKEQLRQEKLKEQLRLYTLIDGSTFNKLIPSSTITSIVFTDIDVPENKTIASSGNSSADYLLLQLQRGNVVDLSSGQTGTIYAWYDLNSATFYVSSPDGIIYANEDCSSMFSEKSNITSITFKTFDTSQVTNMSSMFYLSGLTSLDVSEFDTSNVTNMSSMFFGCTRLTSLDLSNFDTNQVTDMSYMFANMQNLTSLNVSKFDTSNVTNMSYMFYHEYKLTTLDLSNFDTSKVTDMSYMFDTCPYLTSLDLSKFNISNVTTISYMFYTCNLLEIIYASDWTNNEVILNTSNMFSSCKKLPNWSSSKTSGAYAKPTTDGGYFTTK
jgi:surface protein